MIAEGLTGVTLHKDLEQMDFLAEFWGRAFQMEETPRTEFLRESEGGTRADTCTRENSASQHCKAGGVGGRQRTMTLACTGGRGALPSHAQCPISAECRLNSADLRTGDSAE